ACVDFSGGQFDVPEDVADVGQRDAGLVEVHGLAVAQRVRRDAGVGQCRVGCLGMVFAGGPGDPAAAELAAVLVEEQRVVIVAGLVEAVFGQVGVKERGRVVGEGDVAGLAAFAGQDGQGRGLQADVAYGEVGEFLDPGCGVVEGGEQGRVAAA